MINFNQLFNLHREHKLPESFLFGVATADHQCEAYVEEYKDIQDLWEEKKNLEKRDKATDFWHRYAEDIELAKNMGCKLFRFSIAWARVEPEAGVYNDEAFEHYRELLETIKEAGMEPIVTLHHYTWPLHVEARGGSIADDFPSMFATYADETARRLGHLIKYWVTFNEPNQLIFGYFKAGEYHLPPGLPPGTSYKQQMATIRKLIPNLFEANARARAAIQKHHPSAKIGANPFLFGLPPIARWFVDRQVTKLKEEDSEKQGNRWSERKPNWGSDVDVVAAMFSITEKRNKTIDFSRPYYIDRLKILVPVDSNIDSLDDLERKWIGVLKNSSAVSKVIEILPESEEHIVGDTQSAVNAIETGRVAGLLGDQSWLEGILQKYPDRYKFLEGSFGTELYGVGVPKGHPQVLDVVNLAVEQYRDTEALQNSVMTHKGTLDNFEDISAIATRQVSLMNMEFMSSAELMSDQAYPLAVEGSLLRKIQDRGYLIAGIPENAPGFSAYNPETKEYEGIDIDLLKTIAQVIFGDSSKIKYKPIKGNQRESCLRNFFDFLDPILETFTTLSTIFNSNWWSLGLAGKLPEFLCPPSCVNQLDYVGFDYYWGTPSFCPEKLIELGNAANGNYTKAPVWPQGLYNLLKDHAKLFPGMEIIIVENGCVDSADDTPREEYIRLHLEQMRKAYQEGMNVKGYVCWAITTNKEWGLKFAPSNDFGLYHIALDTDPELKRVPTSSVEVYKQMIVDR